LKIKIAGSFYSSHNNSMKIKTYEGALVPPAVAAEIEALYQEVNTLKKHIANTDKVVFDLLEVLKGAAIPYRK